MRLFLLSMAALCASGADRCSALRESTGYEFAVVTAVAMPDHCRVTGLIQPEVRFEVDLPTQWNGKLLVIGNGGYAGEPMESQARAGQRTRALSRGFAFAFTNTGHEAAGEPLGAFAVNPQKLVDYAFRAIHVTTVTAKTLARTYYGRPAERSYYEGCSTGGRQGLISAQRFPQDFDGIIAGAPVLNFTGTMVSYARMLSALRAAPIATAKVKVLAERVLQACDARDGVKDGVIDDPRRCDFSPRRDLTVCANDEADCFTPAQIAAMETVYSPVTFGGRPWFPGWPLGAEPGWSPWLLRDDGPTISRNFGEAFFRYLAFPRKDPAYDLAQFDIEKDVPRLESIHRTLDATDTDLSAFQSRGGKLLMHFGWADPALNPMMGVQYYESVLSAMGPATPEFFRLFMVPGMLHCAGGAGTDRFDSLSVLTDWVEKGRAPDRIRAARVVEGREIRTRPLCPYPLVAVYKGTGSTDDAANFTCAARP